MVSVPACSKLVVPTELIVGARIEPALKIALPVTVSVALLGLEMKRLVRQLPGKLFVRNV